MYRIDPLFETGLLQGLFCERLKGVASVRTFLLDASQPSIYCAQVAGVLTSGGCASSTQEELVCVQQTVQQHGARLTCAGVIIDAWVMLHNRRQADAPEAEGTCRHGAVAWPCHAVCVQI